LKPNGLNVFANASINIVHQNQSANPLNPFIVSFNNVFNNVNNNKNPFDIGTSNIEIKTSIIEIKIEDYGCNSDPYFKIPNLREN